MSKKSKHYDHLLSLLLLGDSGVGKSALLMRFADDTFTESFIATIGIDFKIQTLQIDGKTVKLQIWDTAGQEKFRTITSAYYRGAMGILLVYDVTDDTSFINVRNWMRQIRQCAAAQVCLVLVGNKVDMESDRKITTEQGEELAAEFGIPFHETSAKSNLNVQEAFLALSQDVLRTWGNLANKNDKEKSRVSLSSASSNSNSPPCCK